jgi:membrane protease YdiL (CAAX protease family)
MAKLPPDQGALLRLLLLVLAALMLADLVLLSLAAVGRASRKPLLASRWSAAHVLIAMQAWMALTLFLVGVVAAIAAVVTSSVPARAAANDTWMQPILLLSVVAQDAAMAGVVLYTVVVLYDQLPAAAGLSLRGWRPKASLGLMAAVVVLPVNLLLERLSRELVRYSPAAGLVQRDFQTQFGQLLGLFRGPGGLLSAVVVIGLFAPFCEELFFRGFAYRCFHTRWGPMAGMLLSATLFSLIHLHPVGLLPIFVVGCALAYLYERTGTLVAPFALHAANNIAAVLFLHFGRGR